MDSFCVAVAMSVLSVNQAQLPFKDWVTAQNTFAQQKVFESISRADTAKGMVVASPSKKDPNYYYHWVRDAALVMSTVIDDMRTTRDEQLHSQYAKKMQEYIAASHRQQQTPNRSGSAMGRGLGEPKFNVDGSSYDGDWGRPQNDGPALRAITLIKYSRSKPDYWHIIKPDLEYTAHHWWEDNFEPWEEVRGYHFYNRLVQYRALKDGAKLALEIGDRGAADFYLVKADEIKNALKAHWSSEKNILLTTLEPVTGGLDYKHSNLDIQVILGALHTRGSEYGPTDGRILATALQLVQTFSKLYPINSVHFDREGKRMGPGIGRYGEDKYNGNGFGEANPWFLATNAMAELYYAAANDWAAKGVITLDANTKRFVEDALGTHIPMEKLHSWEPQFRPVLNALLERGDSFLRRVRFHAAAEGNMAEQFDKNTGFQRGAKDLTWSYASFTTATKERERLVQRLGN